MKKMAHVLKTGYGPMTLMYRLDEQASEVMKMARAGRVSKRSARRVEKLLRRAVSILMEEYEETSRKT